MNLDIIKSASVGAIKSENPMRVLWGRVISTNPLKVKVGDLLVLGKKQLIVDSPVVMDEEVVLLSGNKNQRWLLLSTIEKVIDGTTGSGGIVGVAPEGGFTATKYALTNDQLLQLASLCQQEQGSVAGAAAEASLMCNLFEKRGSRYGKGANGLYKYVRNSGWFAHAGRYMNKRNATSAVVSACRSVFIDGKRTIPTYVDEHDCFSDIVSAKNNGVSIKKTNRSAYKQGVTVIRNRYGSTYTFYCFPAPNSDPFGYTSRR